MTDKMNRQKAIAAIIAREEASKPTPEQHAAAIEALKWLIDQYHDPHDIVYLGGIYYGAKKYNLAEKYYLIAAEQKSVAAANCLGYIYYYGRTTGVPDYEKAFKYFSQAAELGDMQAAYKVADMYRSGKFVEKDYDKFAQTIKDLWGEVKSEWSGDGEPPYEAMDGSMPVAELAMRMGGISAKAEKPKDAIKYYEIAKSCLAERLAYHGFFGNYTNMEITIARLYELRPIDEAEADLWDIYELSKSDCDVKFNIGKKHYTIEIRHQEDMLTLKFGEQYYHNIKDLMHDAMIGKESLARIALGLRKVEVIHV